MASVVSRRRPARGRPRLAVLSDGHEQVLVETYSSFIDSACFWARSSARAAARHVLAAAAAHLRHLLERRVELRGEALRAHAELAENGRDHAVLLGEQRVEQVLRLHRLVAALARERLRRLQRVLGLDRQLVESHRRLFLVTVGPLRRAPGLDGRRSLQGRLIVASVLSLRHTRVVNRSQPPAGARTALSRPPSTRPAS